MSATSARRASVTSRTFAVSSSTSAVIVTARFPSTREREA